jgi:chromosome segregation ATPase
MGDVNRPFKIFRVSVPDGEYSRRADVIEKTHYDAALAREAAERLRGDVAVADANDAERREAALRLHCGGMQMSLDEAAEREAALREYWEKYESGRQYQIELVHEQRQELAVMQQRLTAAEQRNAAVDDLLNDMLKDDDMPAHWFAQRISALLDKPTESGARECLS